MYEFELLAISFGVSLFFFEKIIRVRERNTLQAKIYNLEQLRASQSRLLDAKDREIESLRMRIN